MREITSLTEANRILAGFVPRGAGKRPYTLERMRALMAHLGNPQDKLKVVHVAGTSGKTSTSYYIAALLKSAGYKVGLTVSPHVTAVNERLQFGLTPLPEAQFCQALSEFLGTISSSGIEPTYFELLVALAYWEFARRSVDYAVVEVGLGGLLDGTNVVTQADKICVITDIGFDHIKVLGNTLAEIAAQKTGIIQPGNHVFTYAQGQEIDEVFARVTDERRATLHRVAALGDDYPQPSLPLFQRRNFYLAEQAVGYILERDGRTSLDESQLQAASRTLIPARMETFGRGGKTIILDGAHNQQKLHALAESVRGRFPGRSVAAIVSFGAGEEYRLAPALQEVIALADHIIITAFSGEQDAPKRSVEPAMVAGLLDELHFSDYEIVADPEQALTALLARPEPLGLVTGSFYLLNHIRPLMMENND